MAFLCPSRRGRQRKKKLEKQPEFLGRITGSASVDTLVRVGLEKQHGLTPDDRMTVTQDFLATTDGELSTQTGDSVYKLFQENEWVYVITEQGQEGFVPLMCLSLGNKTPSKSAKSVKHKATNSQHEKNQNSDDSMLAEEGSDSSLAPHNRCSHPTESNDKQGGVPTRSLSMDIPDVISDNGGHPVGMFSQKKVDKPDIKTIPLSTESKAKAPVFQKEPQRPQISDVSSKRICRNSASSNSSNSKTGPVDFVKHRRDDSRSSNRSCRVHSTSSQNSASSDHITEVRTFCKRPQGKLLVIFTFEAWDEGDLSIERGEVVTSLNNEDPLWTMVRKLDGQEGFVPAAYMCSYPEDLQGDIKGKSSQQSGQIRPENKLNYHDVRDLVTLRHFTAQSADDISVERGEQVFADLANQIEREWLWVYAAATGRYGYIPRDNVVHADGSPLPKEPYLQSIAQRPP